MTSGAWESLTLGDLGKWITGSTPSSSDNANKGDDVLFVTPGDIGYGGRLGEVARRISNIGADNVRRIKPGSVILVCIGTIGKVAWTDLEITTNQQINTLEVDQSKFDIKFAHWLLASPIIQEQLWQNSTSTTVSLINKKTLEKIPCSAPPLDEQRRIVEALDDHLSRLDKAIAEVNASLSKVEAEWTSFLTKVFSGNFQGSGYSKWTFPKLNELVSTPKDIVDGPFGSNLKSSHYVDKGARVVRLQNIGYGAWVQADAFVSKEHARTLSKHNVRQGDLLFASLMDTRPRVCIAPYLGDDAIVKSDCIRIRIQDQTVARWAMLATQTATASIWANGKVHGLGRGRLGLSAIRDFVVPVPPLNQLQKILDFIEIHEGQTGNLKSACFSIAQEIQTLRKSILRKYLTNEKAARS